MLLLSAPPIQMEERIGTTFATSIPIKEIAIVCGQAGKQKKPGAWARRALEGRWKAEEKIDGETSANLQRLLDEQGQRASSLFESILKKPQLVREPDETDEGYLRRVMATKRDSARG